MNREFVSLLARAYEGEISGQVLFDDLSRRFPEHGRKLETLALLEERMGSAY
jgi:hypothetical protein